MNDLSQSTENAGEMPPPTSGRPIFGGASSSNSAAGGRSSGAKRGRPVITVLEARPMNEVGFRDQSGNNPVAKRSKPEITVIGARPMSQGEGSGPSRAAGPHDHIYAEIPPVNDRSVHPQAQRGQMDILPPASEEAPPTYHEAITETGADGGPPPDLPNRPTGLASTKSVPSPRPKTLPPPRPPAPPSRVSSLPTSPAEGAGVAGGANRTSRHGSTSSGEVVPTRPPPPAIGRPVAKPRGMVAGGASASGGETKPEDFVPIKGKKPVGIAVFPLANKPSVPAPIPREKPQTETEGSQRPEPAPRKPGPPPVKPGKVPISVSMDSIPHSAASAEHADNVANINMERVEQARIKMPPVRVLPAMPGSVSMDNIRSVSEESAAQTQPVIPTPRKRPPVKPRPMSMPPSEIDITVQGQGQTVEASSGAEINKRLSGSAFALHIEDDAHALVPRELRDNKSNLAPKPNKPPKPGVKPKPVLPSKPKPPVVATKPEVKQSRTSWYTGAGEAADVSTKPKEGQRTTWYAASPVETENLMDLTSLKKPDPLPHGPTIIRRSTSKQTVTPETPTDQAGSIKVEKCKSSEQSVQPGATPFDSPEKSAPVVSETKRPTIIKPLKAKTIKSITKENSLGNVASNHPAEESTKSPTASDMVSSNVHTGTQSATAPISVDIPSNTTEVPLQPVHKPTILRPATLSKPKGPATAAKPLISPKSRTPHHEELSENIVNEAKHNLNRFSMTSEVKAENIEGASNNNEQSQCESCNTDDKAVSKRSHKKPEECPACKNNDDEFYDHTCEKAPPKSPVKSPPKSPAKSPRLAAPIGFEALMSHLNASDIPQDSTATKQPITGDTSSNQAASVPAHSPSESNISVEDSNKVLSQEKEVPHRLNTSNSSLTGAQSPTPAQVSPKPQVVKTKSTKLNASVKEETENQNSKVPPPLPSAPPVGSQWDLRQLQLNSPTRPDQPPTPTTPRALPERETTPDGQQNAENKGSSTPTTVKKTPPGRPPPARPAPPRPGGPPRPAGPPTNKKLYPSLSTEINASSAAEADNVSTSPKSPGRPAAKPTMQGAQPPSLPERPGPGHPLYHYVVSGPHGIALFDYSSEAPGDLSFKSGDVIELISWVDEEWMKGKVTGREGIFPVNFCDVVEPLPDQKPTQEKVAVKMPSWDDVGDTTPSIADITGPRCVARFDFEGEGEEDLSFKEGDVIVLKQRVGEWLKGELRGKFGIFPLSFVEVIEDLPSEPASCNGSALPSAVVIRQPESIAQQNKNEEPHCIAVHSYASKNAEDLTFSEGDRITLTQRLDPDWLMGKIDDRSGIFPANFVKIIRDFEEPKDPHENGIASQNTEKESSPVPAPPEPLTPSAPPAMPGDEPELTSFGTTASGPSTSEAAAPEPVAPSVSSPSATESSSHTPVAPTPSARAMFDFDGGTPEDISFKVGDKIELLEKIGDGSWLKGRLGDGRTGMFPANFVSITHPLPDS